MATTADRLALLQRTKAGQRALLEEMYPDLDFSTVPFREYGRLFSGRKYVPGFAGGWKSYGRSNSEDASTRDILPDYSGNGRDIKLYNFAFAGMSGFGGYERNWDEWLDVYIVNNGHNYQENNVLHILEISPWANTLSDVVSGETVKLKLRVSGLSEDITNNEVQNIQLYFNASTAGSTLYIREDGDYDVNLTAPEGATKFYILAKSTETLTGWTPLTTPITIEQLPTYPGGLVSDGVDDYGQCIKGFSLPDDYTVVALRKIITGNNAAIASKGATIGAFLFDAASGGNNVAAWSYGYQNSLNNLPVLFSYQTKTSYNGTAISFGIQADTESDLIKLFTHNNSSCAQAVLYDLRIYDHTLTAEELAAVKDEMMSDYEAATGGGIADITYVADWDGKDRSNEEDEPMRSQWVDKKTGKVIELHNFGYAGMSGWGGCGTDMSKLVPHNDIAVTETTYMSLKCTRILKQSNTPISEWGPNRIASGSTTIRFRITGVSDNLSIRFESYTLEEGLKTLFTSTGDGVYTAEISDPAKYYRWIAVLPADAVYPVNCNVTIEQLPLYPGALVGDGIDDYGVTQEAINEEVGTMLVYARLIDESAGGGIIS